MGGGKGIYLFLFCIIKLFQHMSFHSFSVAILSHTAGQKVGRWLCAFSCLRGLKSDIHSILHITSFLYFFHFQLYTFSPTSFSTWNDVCLALSFLSSDYLSNFPYRLFFRDLQCGLLSSCCDFS